MKEISQIFDKISTFSKKEKEDFFSTLFTNYEIEEFEIRAEIFKWILAWETQRNIAKNLWISITTVTRWSKVIKNKSEKIKNLFKN